MGSVIGILKTGQRMYFQVARGQEMPASGAPTLGGCTSVRGLGRPANGEQSLCTIN